MTLKDLPAGKKATITKVGSEGALRQHFLDMGVIPDMDIVPVKYAPLGDFCSWVWTDSACGGCRKN